MTEPEAKPEAASVQPATPEGRSTQDVLLIIAAIGVVVANVIGVAGGIYLNAKIQVGKEQAVRFADASDKKLDGIHQLANANLAKANDSLAEVNKQLQDANGRIGKLEQLLVEEKSKPEADP